MKTKKVITTIALFLVFLVVVSLIESCVPSNDQDSVDDIGDESTYVEETTYHKDKLGQYLTELLNAYEQGNIAVYAQQYHFIEISDESYVKIVVETYPDTAEEALESVSQVGDVIGTYKTYIDVIVAMDDIYDLTLDSAISLVRLPHVATDSCREQWDDILRIREISNPKLYSPLNLLVLPENQDRIDEIIGSCGLELLPGNCLRLVVEADPDNVEAAIDYCAQYGDVETVWEDLIQVVVAINRLEKLTESSLVQNIRLPYKTWPVTIDVSQ